MTITTLTLPSDFDNWLEYGNDLSNCNEFDAAAEAFEHHLDANPYDYESLYSVGWALCMAERYSDALPYLRDAVELNPYGDATEYYEMACLAENPHDYDALYSVGWAYCMAERYSDALPYLRDAVALNPNGEATEYYEMAQAETSN